MTSVAFIVIAFNEARTIAQTIESIVGLNGLPRQHKVLVVDDGSTDATASIVENIAKQNPNVSVLRQSNAGRGAARSAGVLSAGGYEFIAFVDADIILPEHWWLTCQKEIASRDAVGGIAVPDGDVSYVFWRFKLKAKVRPHTTTVSGGNGLYRASVFEKVAFDPKLRNGEDVALNAAMVGKNLAIETISELVVTHNEHRTFGQTCAWLFESGVGATRQLIQYRKWRLPDTALVVFLAALVLAIAFGSKTLVWWILPPAAVVAIALFHLRSKFKLVLSQSGSYLAVLTQSAVEFCYLLGRLVGFAKVATWKRHRG